MQCSLFWKAQRKTFAFLYNKYKWYLAFGALVLIMCHYHGYHALFITLPKAFSDYIGIEINSSVALIWKDCRNGMKESNINKESVQSNDVF